MEVECKRSNVQAIKYTYLYLVVSEPKHCPLGARSHAGAQRRVHEGYKRASTAVKPTAPFIYLTQSVSSSVNQSAEVQRRVLLVRPGNRVHPSLACHTCGTSWAHPSPRGVLARCPLPAHPRPRQIKRWLCRVGIDIPAGSCMAHAAPSAPSVAAAAARQNREAAPICSADRQAPP